MSDLTRANLQRMLNEHGEEPPKSWTRAELLLRVEELTNTNMSKSQPAAKDTTTYRYMVQELNKAARKKADLQKHCQDTLRMNVNFNHTIAQLQREAMIKIYVMSKPDPTDVMGFGKHAALSYSTVRGTYPEYCEWAKSTAKEGPCDPRLRRFAGWLANDVHMVQQAAVEMETKLSASEGNLRTSTPQTKVAPKTTTTSSTSSHEGEEIGSVTMSGYQLQALVNTIQDLKDEVAVLKGERPRKKTIPEDHQSTASDFSMVTSRLPEP
eukprot:s3080_g3.t1